MKHIRLETDAPISDEHIELVFAVISDHAEIELTTALDDEGHLISDEVAICAYESQDHVTYEIRVADDTSDDVMEKIAQELDQELDATVDFRLEISEV